MQQPLQGSQLVRLAANAGNARGAAVGECANGAGDRNEGGDVGAAC